MGEGRKTHDANRYALLEWRIERFIEAEINFNYEGNAHRARARDFESHVRTLSILRLNTYETSINNTNAIILLKIGKKKKREREIRILRRR